MTVDLSLIIADLENKIAAADSNTPILDLLQMVTAAERLTGGKNVYDSVGLLPADSAYIGTIAMTADGTIRLYTGQGWDTLDSSSYVPPDDFTFQGSVSGYTLGGEFSFGSYTNVIDKFPFAADANATDVGDLTEAKKAVSGTRGETHGYRSGGSNAPVPSSVNVIDKFSFSTDGNATDVGDLTNGVSSHAGQSSKNYGYASGGYDPSGGGSAGRNAIEKYSHVTDENSASVGSLAGGRKHSPAGQSSTTNGYTSAGQYPPVGVLNTIDKFPFSVDNNSSDVGDLTAGRYGSAGQSSSTHGYTTGGTPQPAAGNVIDKFSFSTDANATDVGDLIGVPRGVAGQSSTTHGYAAGGFDKNPWGPNFISNVIQKFPFSTDENSTDIADMTTTRGYAAGTQV